MEIKSVKLSELKPLEQNVRIHTEAQVKELMRSVQKFGQTRAMVIDENNTILVGNGLHMAMTQLGLTHADVYQMTGLSERDKKKLILTDNRTFSLGADDYDNIEALIKELGGDGDYDIPGFDEESLRAMNREMEQVMSDVESYGLIDSPDDLKAPVKTAPAPAPAPEPIQEQDEAPAQPSYHQAASVHRIVTCPKCGEQIEA